MKEILNDVRLSPPFRPDQLLPLIHSRWDRYLGMTAPMTQNLSPRLLGMTAPMTQDLSPRLPLKMAPYK